MLYGGALELAAPMGNAASFEQHCPLWSPPFCSLLLGGIIQSPHVSEITQHLFFVSGLFHSA
jgi:hypothetical protein